MAFIDSPFKFWSPNSFILFVCDLASQPSFQRVAGFTSKGSSLVQLYYWLPLRLVQAIVDFGCREIHVFFL